MERKKGLDFVRAISALGIIAFHFYCHSFSTHRLFYSHANGQWGGVLNYLFFALSGLVLQLNYGPQKNLHLGKFYYKRWKAMMPAYIVVFLYAFFMNVFTYGRIFYMDIPKSRLLLSFIGLDGYMAWIEPTYFITGEWFLGAVLIAYAVYPLLRLVVNCRYRCIKYIVLVIMATLYATILRVDYFRLPDAVNPVTCLLCFFVGMLMATKFPYFKKLFVVLPAVFVAGFLIFVSVPGSNITKEMLIGWSLLIVAYNIGEIICKFKMIDRTVALVSSLTYPTFLLHHSVIYKVLTGFNSVSTVRSFVALIVIILVTLGFSTILDMFMKRVLNSWVFKKLDGIMLKEK
jgi:peptidoglycan/LPS O-acetylase OafA/YrhL